MLFFGNSENSENFKKANIPKVILCDPKDNMVVEFSSLKSSISNKHISQKFNSLNSHMQNKKFLQKNNNSIMLFCFDYNKEDLKNFEDILFLIYNTQNENIENFKFHLHKFMINSKKNLKGEENTRNNNINSKNNNKNENEKVLKKILRNFFLFKIIFIRLIL